MAYDRSPMARMQQVELGLRQIGDYTPQLICSHDSLHLATGMQEFRSRMANLQTSPDKLEINISNERILFLNLATNQSV